MKKRYSTLWLLFVLLFCSNSSLFSQTIIYVDSSASGLNTGKSWKDAYNVLDSAIIHAVDENDEYSILVAKGTYTPSLIPGNIKTGNVRDVSFYITFSGGILGGYSPGGSVLNNQLYPTILSGDIGKKNDSLDNAYHVLTLQNSEILISGITITGGNADGTGSLLVNQGNVPRNRGGGIYMLNGYADISDIIAAHNYAFYGGALYNDSSEVDITNAVFEYNSSNRGGAIYNNSYSTSTITNIVAYRNFAKNAGGAIINDNATEYNINNCTFVENHVVGFYGGAIYNTINNSTSKVKNCLFSGNYSEYYPSQTSYPGVDIIDSANTVNASYCVFQTDIYQGNNNYVLTGTGLADINNPKGPDNTWMTKDDGLSITVESQAFKNGGNGNTELDITGVPRDEGNNNFDIGAYELNKCGQVTGRVIFVDSSATGLHTGNSWANAFVSLQTGINLARLGCVDTIKVAAGTYYPSNFLLGTDLNSTSTETFQLSSDVAILGGYAHGGSSVANPLSNKTILSNKNKRVIFAGNVTNVLLSGLYIQDGNVQGTGNFEVYGINYPVTDGGGVLLYNSSMDLRDCYIRNNYGSGKGGGMVAVNSVVKMLRCSFESNRAGNEGGGLYIENLGAGSFIDSSNFINNKTNYLFGGAMAIEGNQPPVKISNSRFTGNSTLTAAGNVGGGGAIYSNTSTRINITKCVFDSNHGFYGGAIYFGNSARSDVFNSFFLNNSASASGGAIDCRGNEANFYNNVFSGNKAANRGGALYSESHASVFFSTFIRNDAGVEGGAVDGYLYLANSITWLNSIAGDSLAATVDFGGNVSVGSCAFQVAAATGNNIKVTDPKFGNINDIAGVDGIYGTIDDGLSLTLQSPLVNQGGADYDISVIRTDIIGAPRVQSMEADIGAYEIDFCGLSNFVNKTIYVDSSAIGGNNTGRDWPNAFTDLETAFITFRSGCKLDTIKVAKGTYFPTAVPGYSPYMVPNEYDKTFYLDENLVLLGGYPAGGGVRDFRKNPTLLSGRGYLQHVVLINNKSNVMMDGFNIVDGFSNDDGIVHTRVDNQAISTFGGGLYASNSKLNIKNINFINNNGSGAFLNGCTGSMTYCVWDGNQSDFAGGGVFSSGSSVEFDNCIFYKNIGLNSWGGGLFINRNNFGTPSFKSCTFYGNSSTWGGGIFSGTTPNITNCAFWGNSSGNKRPDSTANDIYVGTFEPQKIVNSLFQFKPVNSPQGINCIYGLNPDMAGTTNGKGADNTWGTSDDGLRQTGTSYTINNGINDSIPADLLTDITGAPRINTGVVDIGAYEYDCGFTNLISMLVPAGQSEVTANTFNTCGTWQYRTSTTDPSKYIIEIDPNGNSNFNPLQIKIDATNSQSHFAANDKGDTTVVAFRMVSINAPGEYPVNGGMKIRIFYNPAELDTLSGRVHYWFKHTAHDKNTVLSNLMADTLLNEVPIIPSGYGIINGIHYVEFDSLNSFSTFGYVGVTHVSGLPLNYLSFTAKWQETEKSVLLNWVTANEVNVQSFIVERSAEAKVWNSIGNMDADLSSSLSHSYKWVDKEPLSGNSYYRIKELDNDGRITLSPVRMIRRANETTIFKIVPNPVKNTATIKLAVITPVVNYKVADVTGRTIWTGQLKNQSEFSFSMANQSEGIYFVTVNGITQKLILSK